MANLQLCSKPPPVLKRQHLKAAKSSGEKEHWTWTASDPFLSMRPVSFLCSPLAHLSKTVTWDTHFPLSQCPYVYPDGKVSGGKAGDAGAQQQEPWASLSLSGSSVWSGLSLCSRLPPAPAQSVAACARMCPRASRGVCVAVSDPALGCQPLLPSMSLWPRKLTPHSCSSRSSLWFPLHASLHPANCSLSESPG